MNAPAFPAVETAPASWYREPAFWALERRQVFAKTWQFFAHESLAPEPGSWVAETIAGFPLVVIRDEGGDLKGFHNVCRHRAGPLTQGETGQCDGALVCRYHGWRYSYDGRLKLARDFGPAPDFDPRQFGLFPIRVETWRGLVFVSLEPDIAPLSQWVAPLESRLKSSDWGGLKVALKRNHPIACNWKTYVENYLEGYHVPVMHPSLDAEIDSDRYAVNMDGYVALHEAPLRRSGAVYDGLWAWLWPNLGVNVYGEGIMLERISPLGHAATRLDYIYLMPDGVEVSDETLAMSDTVTEEDVWITQQVQINLNSDVYEKGRLSTRHEGAVAAFQAFIREAIRN
jgi:choline monooxygenase